MSELSANEIVKQDHLEIFLRSFETEMQLAKGVKRNVDLLTLNTPGYDEHIPNVFSIQTIAPLTFNSPSRTIITHTWTADNPGVDVEKHTQRIIFETKRNFLGGNPETKIVDTEDGMIGTKTIYADSDTPRTILQKLKDPMKTAKEMLTAIQSFSKKETIKKKV